MRSKLFIFLLGLTLALFIVIVKADGLPFDPGETSTKPLCVQANGECNINESGKSCCSGLVCLSHGQPSTDGKCGVAPTATPSITPSVLPSVTPTQQVECPTQIKNDCGVYIRVLQ